MPTSSSAPRFIITNREPSTLSALLHIPSVDTLPTVTMVDGDVHGDATLNRIFVRLSALRDKAKAAIDRGDVVTREWVDRFTTIQADFVSDANRAPTLKRSWFARLKSRSRASDDLHAVAKLTTRIDDLFLELLFSRGKGSHAEHGDRDSVSTSTSSS